MGSTAPGWERWADHYDRDWQPARDALVRGAGSERGMRILDVGTGTGFPAFAVADAVGPTGSVTGIDIAADMLAGCERLAAKRGITNLALHEMDMHELRFPDASFDGATSGFALMFSPRPAAVVAEIRRVLRPNARFAACVWDEPERVPFLSTLFAALAQVVPPPPRDPLAPGPFRLSAPGALAAVCLEGGLRDVVVEPVEIVWTAASLDEQWARMADLAAPLANALAAQPASAAAIRTAYDIALAPYVRDGRVALPSNALLVRART